MNTLPTTSTEAIVAPVVVLPAAERVPPLESGDCLTRAEFERRYRATPEKFKAELIEGVVYTMATPVSADGHSLPHFRFVGWLALYEAQTPGTEGGDNGTIRLDLDNVSQPDAFLRILPNYGGQSRKSDDDYIEGAPELVAEIAASSASYDLHQKLNAYRRNGVREYIVWRTWDRAIDWFVLHEGTFVPLAPDEQGIHKSTVFPGLWLDAAAMLAGERARVMAVAQQGIASPEHQQFIEHLAQQQKQKETP
jgi:Uma2 family endonuclease